jgi:molecular chaperone GrpE
MENEKRRFTPEQETDETGDMDGAPDCSQLQLELDAERVRYVRLASDFASFRKRTARDSEQQAAAQKDAFVRELLPVVDNLERALSSNATGTAVEIRRGVEMTHQQLLDLLKRHGIEPEETLGLPFNPERHEALSARFDPEQPDQTVIEVVQRGYRRGEEMIRPARVIINDLSQGFEDGHGG